MHISVLFQYTSGYILNIPRALFVWCPNEVSLSTKRSDAEVLMKFSINFVEPIWVITRYAARGDLLGFLRKSRGINDTTYRDLTKKPKTNLCPKQLMQMAKDIACGMTHLSLNKVLLLKNIYKKLFCKYYLIGKNWTKYCYLVYHCTNVTFL